MRAVERIEKQAADWLLRRQAGLAPDDERRLQQWRAADPRHAAAYDELEAAWAVVSYPAELGEGETAVRRLDGRRRRRARRRTGAAISALGLAAAAALLFIFAPGRKPPLSIPHPSSTVALHPDRQRLPDGSIAELNANARIEVDYSPGRRRVRLVHGDALFEVVKDPARPFVVSAAEVEVQAVGTAFWVHLDPAEVNVLVTEGRVAIKRARDGRNLLGPAAAFPPATRTDPLPGPVLTAGHRVEISVAAMADGLGPPRLAVTAVSPEEVSAALVWRDDRIEFTRTTLAEAARLFNGRNRIQLTIADPAAADLRITGIFEARDSEGFVRLLEQGFHLRADRTGDLVILRSP